MVSVLLLMMAASSISTLRLASASANSHQILTYVMLMNPACDFDLSNQFENDLHMSKMKYEQYIDNYRVICLGGVKNLADVDAYIVPNLRTTVPQAKFVFVYPDSMTEEYRNYLEGKYGYQYRYLALGNTDLPSGIAYANEVPANVKHEMGHLDSCGTWHDEEGRDIGRIVRHPQADQFPWCKS